MGVTIRSTVKKAAKLAVYEEMRINVKNHQTAPTILPDIDLKTQRPKVKTCEDDVYLLTQEKGKRQQQQQQQQKSATDRGTCY